jgi:hypothetical protein
VKQPPGQSKNPGGPPSGGGGKGKGKKP